MISSKSRQNAYYITLTIIISGAYDNTELHWRWLFILKCLIYSTKKLAKMILAKRSTMINVVWPFHCAMLWGNKSYQKLYLLPFLNIWTVWDTEIIAGGKHGATHPTLSMPWVSYQVSEIADAHAQRMPGTFSPPPWVSDADMHHGTCVRYVPWCMPGSLTCGFLWRNVPGIPGACATRNFTYLVRGPWPLMTWRSREPVFQHPFYWHISPGVLWFHTKKDRHIN